LPRHPPSFPTRRSSDLVAQRHDIAADVDERILDAVFPKKVSRAIERVAFRVAAEVELHGRVFARHCISLNAQIAHARVGTNDSRSEEHTSELQSRFDLV